MGGGGNCWFSSAAGGGGGSGRCMEKLLLCGPPPSITLPLSCENNNNKRWIMIFDNWIITTFTQHHNVCKQCIVFFLCGKFYQPLLYSIVQVKYPTTSPIAHVSVIHRIQSIHPSNLFSSFKLNSFIFIERSIFRLNTKQNIFATLSDAIN